MPKQDERKWPTRPRVTHLRRRLAGRLYCDLAGFAARSAFWTFSRNSSSSRYAV